MVCNVFDLNLNPLGTIFSWISLVWDEYYNALGEAQLELAYTADNASLIKANRYLSIDGSSHLMLIETVEITKDRLVAYGKDALNILDKRVCTENTAARGGGKLMPVSYEDLLLRKAPQQDKRTGDEIAADVIKRAGLKVVRKDNGPV